MAWQRNKLIAGVVTAAVGVIISIGHLVFGLFDSVPEQYHSHDAIIVLGFALGIVGLLLLITKKPG